MPNVARMMFWRENDLHVAPQHSDCCAIALLLHRLALWPSGLFGGSVLVGRGIALAAAMHASGSKIRQISRVCSDRCRAWFIACECCRRGGWVKEEQGKALPEESRDSLKVPGGSGDGDMMVMVIAQKLAR